ncbi:hypothetical protein FRC12_007536 [Ceratobasidium sp. 428]|nr:hypothetical protein FRC12_007536 [Ceratobasidium sp. 428]
MIPLALRSELYSASKTYQTVFSPISDRRLSSDVVPHVTGQPGFFDIPQVGSCHLNVPPSTLPLVPRPSSPVPSSPVPSPPPSTLHARSVACQSRLATRVQACVPPPAALAYLVPVAREHQRAARLDPATRTATLLTPG